MTDFDEIMAGIVSELPIVVINSNMSQFPKFYWGRSVDLPLFLTANGKDHFPLVWSVNKEDSQTEIDGLWTRQAELNLCTLETRKDLLNTTRIEDGYSFKTVLYPLWASIEKRIQLSENLVIRDGTLKKSKHPNFSTETKYEFPVIWDVLKISFTAEFNADNEC